MKITTKTAHFTLRLPIVVFSFFCIFLACSFACSIWHCPCCTVSSGTSESRVLIWCCHGQQLSAKQLCTPFSSVALLQHLSWIWAGSVAQAASAATLLLTVPGQLLVPCDKDCQSHLARLIPHHSSQKEGKEEITPCNTPHTRYKYHSASENKITVLHSCP